MKGKQNRSIKTKQKLLSASREIFIEKGFEKTTIKQIINKADLGYGTAYSYYDGKEGMLIVIMEEVMDKFYEIATLQYEPDSLLDAKEQIKKQIKLFLNLANTERKILKVVYEARGFSRKIDKNWINIRTRFTEMIAENIQFAQDKNLAKPEVNKYIVAKGWFFINEMYLWDIVTNDDYPYTIDEISKALLSVYTTGLYFNE